VEEIAQGDTGVGGKVMIGVRSKELSTIVDAVFDVLYVGTGVNGVR
jgi:hypothetical protein